jgi:hypothetical protein
MKKTYFAYLGFCAAILSSFVLGGLFERGTHRCPLPSVQHVQREINAVLPGYATPLEVDGVAGSKTCTEWMMYSVGWENNNNRKILDKL